MPLSFADCLFFILRLGASDVTKHSQEQMMGLKWHSISEHFQREGEGLTLNHDAGARLAVKAGGDILAKGVGEQACCSSAKCGTSKSMASPLRSSFVISDEALLCLNDLVADALELVPDSLEHFGPDHVS